MTLFEFIQILEDESEGDFWQCRKIWMRYRVEPPSGSEEVFPNGRDSAITSLRLDMGQAIDLLSEEGGSAGHSVNPYRLPGFCGFYAQYLRIKYADLLTGASDDSR